MPSTGTTRNRLEKQGLGENRNTWGAPKLNTALDLIDASLDGITSKDVGASDTTLTSTSYAADESRARVLVLTGTLTGNRIVTVPAVEKTYVVMDSTVRGGYTLTLKPSGGTGLLLRPGPQAVYSTGSVMTLATPRLDQAPLATAAVDLNSQKISNLATPTATTDATTKAYVDGLAFTTALPAQTGNAGKYVTTDGTTASWSDVTVPDSSITTAKIADANVTFGKLSSTIIASASTATVALGDLALFADVSDGNATRKATVQDILNLATISDGSVTLAKLADLANQRVIGRNTSGTGVPEAVSLTQLLDWISGSVAQGDILYRDSSAWARLAAGTSGHFLKTQGAAANPTWAAAGGTMALIGTTEVTSSVASVTQTGLDMATYAAFLVVWNDVEPANDSNILLMRVGTSGGIDSTSIYESRIDLTTSTNATSGSGGSPGNEWQIGRDIRSAAGSGSNGHAWIYPPGNSGTNAPICYDGHSVSLDTSNGYSIFNRFGGSTTGFNPYASPNFDRIQILFNSGNIASKGRVTVYGLKFA